MGFANFKGQRANNPSVTCRPFEVQFILENMFLCSVATLKAWALAGHGGCSGHVLSHLSGGLVDRCTASQAVGNTGMTVPTQNLAPRERPLVVHPWKLLLPTVASGLAVLMPVALHWSTVLRDCPWLQGLFLASLSAELP